MNWRAFYNCNIYLLIQSLFLSTKYKNTLNTEIVLK